MGADRNFYKILGIPRDATPEVIKKAYRKMALKWHPDKNQDKVEESKAMFQDISEAFSVLSDEGKRRTYDQFGERGLQEGGGGGGGNPFAGFGQGANFQFRGDPADLFKQFFNGGGFGSGGFQSSGGGVRFGFGRDSRPKRRHRIQHHLNCTLEELYCGCRKSIRVVNGHPNYTNEFRNFEIVVQPGWKDGTRAVFERVANSPDPGVDVVFVVTQLKHPVYTRKGGDLHTTVTISLQQALVGINDFLPALDGRRIPLNTTGAVVRPGATMVIRGEGMPLPMTKGRDGRKKGNLHVAFQVVFPTRKLSDYQKQLLAEALPSAL